EDSRALEFASWPEAVSIAAQGLSRARGRVGVLTGGRLTYEDAYAYAKFARVALDTNDVDMRARPHSEEEADFLAARVAGTPVDVAFPALGKAPAVLMAGFDPEDESPTGFLRLRKGYRKRGLKDFSVASHAALGLTKAGGTLVPTVPGDEARTLNHLETEQPESAEAIGREGAIIVVGARIGDVPGRPHRWPPRVDPAPRGCAWGHRRRRAARPAAGRPPRHRRRSTHRGRPLVERRRTAEHRRPRHRRDHPGRSRRRTRRPAHR